MEGLKPYIPISKGSSLSVYSPTSMAYETQLALKQLVKKYGDLDWFVMNRLKYPDKETLFQCLSAEQIDAVALAIHNVEQNSGMVVGDKTGIGKGRIAASMIRYGVLNGYAVAFFTIKSSLFSDLYRDLADIQSDDLVPLVYNNDPDADIRDPYLVGDDGKGKLLSEIKNNRRYNTKKLPEINNLLRTQLTEGRGKLPTGYDFLMGSYSQIANDNISAEKKAKKERKKNMPVAKGNQEKCEFLREYAKKNKFLYILDESHESAGGESIRGVYVREILGYAQGAVYLSATFAKRPDNMPVYGLKTAIKDAQLTDDDLQKVFEKGGLPLQEVAAADLVKGGQMIRREHSYEGIEVIWHMLEQRRTQHWNAYDEVVSIMREIQGFQKEYIKPVIEGVSEQLFGGMSAEERKGLKDLGVNNSDYFSRVGNTIASLIFSIKAVDVAERAIMRLKENKKVVIAFSRTMGSFLSDLGYVDGDQVDRADFAAVLLKGLNSVFTYTVNDGRGNTSAETIDFEDMGPVGQAAYEALVERISSTTTGLPVSPIDTLINIIESAERPSDLGGNPSKYFRVRECTGRNGQIRFEDGVPTYRRFNADVKRNFMQFNNGDADVLLINRSASTGVSAHSSAKFADRRQRWMIIHEPELDIAEEIQKRGRINRTGQVNKPGYEYVSSTVPGEQRQFMVLKGKLRSLDANTTGSQKQSNSQLDIPDFMNKYGGKVIHDYLEQNEDLDTAMGRPCYRKFVDEFGFEDEEKIPDEDIPRRATYRIQMQPVEVQQKFYDDVLRLYDEYITELVEKGEYDLELEYLDYKAELQKRFLYVEANEGTSSPFGRAAVIEQCKVKRLKKPWKLEQIKEKSTEELNGRTPKEYNDEILSRFEEHFVTFKASKLAKDDEMIEDKEQELAKEEVLLANMPIDGKDEKETKKFQAAIEAKEKKIEKLTTRIQKLKDERIASENQLEVDANRLRRALEVFKVGEVARVMTQSSASAGNTYVSAIVIGWGVNYTLDNPFALKSLKVKFAMNSNQEAMRPMSLIHPHMAETAFQTEKTSWQFKESVIKNWNNSINDEAREVRFFLTGNVFKVLNRRDSGRLIRYSTADGGFKNGVTIGSAESMKQYDVDDFIDKNKDTFKPSTKLSGLVDILKRLYYGQNYELRDKPRVSIYKSQSFEEFYLIVSPKGNKDIMIDPDLLALMKLDSDEDRRRGYGQFETYSGNDQFARFDASNLQLILKSLDERHGIKSNADRPLELSIEDESQEQQSGVFRYELQKPFVLADYPTLNYIGYDEPTANHPNGSVSYSFPLSVRQRYENGLIPIFTSIAEPYTAWKNSLDENDNESLKKLILRHSALPQNSMVNQLGVFIFETNKEGGNPEFTFGRYSLSDFGKVAYEDLIGKVNQMEVDLGMVIEMMKLELAA